MLLLLRERADIFNTNALHKFFPPKEPKLMDFVVALNEIPREKNPTYIFFLELITKNLFDKQLNQLQNFDGF